jgi:plasmid stability protein
MATHNNVRVPDDVLLKLQAKAAAEGKAVDDLVEEVLRTSLEEPTLEALIAYGEQRGRSLDFREEDAGDVVHDWRNSHR